jgi:hypothetical protein
LGKLSTLSFYSILILMFFRAGKTNLILLGMADRENATHGVVTIANDYIVHENFTYGIPANNIALVKLAKPVTSMLFQDYVKPITLPEKKYKPGTKITVSGWGLTDDGKFFNQDSFILQK